MGRHKHRQQQRKTVTATNPTMPPTEPTPPASPSAAVAEGGSVDEGLALATIAAPEQGGDLDVGDPATPAELASSTEIAAARDLNDDEPPTEAAPDAGEEDGRGVIIECPLRHTGAYATGNISYLPRWAAQELRDLADGLADQGTRLETGKPVTDTRDAIVWVAEQLKKGRLRGT